MAVLTEDQFGRKWAGKFADNEIQNIDEAMLREFKEDIKQSFVTIEGAGAVANSAYFPSNNQAILSPVGRAALRAGKLYWLVPATTQTPPVVVVPPPVGQRTINMRATYGVLADQKTDNKDALLAFREAEKGQGKTAVVAQFEDGAVLTSNIRWIHNIRWLELQGGPNGTDFMVMPLGDSRDYDWFYQRIFNGGDPFTINLYPVGEIPAYTGTVRRPPAPRFKSAAKGATRIVLVNAADTALFAVGNRVLLFGYDQVGGKSYPPGARYWDWKTITDLNATTGELKLNKGLKYAYDERWHDVQDEYDDIDHRGNSGKPRLVNLDRADFIYPERLVFDRINWAINPAYPNDGRKVSATFIPIGDTVIAKNGRIEGDMDASLSRVVALINMTQVDPGRGKADNELDKGIEKFVVIGGSYTNYFSNGTSCDEAAIKGAVIHNSMAICPRRFIFGEGMTFTADKEPKLIDSALAIPPAGNPVELGVLMPATFIQKPGNQASAAYELFNRHEFTVEIAEGQNIILPADRDTEKLPQSQMEAGRTVLSTPTGSKRMRLESAWQDGEGRFVMTVSGAAPAVGDVLAWSSVSKIIDYGGHTLQGFARRRGETGLLRASAPDSPAGMTRAKLDLLDFDLNGADLTADLRSSLMSFTCHVDTPYTGHEGPLMLHFGTSSYGSIASINLSVAGTRTVTAGGATGQQAGDTLTPAQFGANVFQDKIHVILRGSNGGPGNGGVLNRAPAVLPVIRLIIDSLDVETVDITNVPDFTY